MIWVVVSCVLKVSTATRRRFHCGRSRTSSRATMDAAETDSVVESGLRISDGAAGGAGGAGKTGGAERHLNVHNPSKLLLLERDDQLHDAKQIFGTTRDSEE